MKPNQETHSVTVTGSTASGSFGISKEDEAAVMGILRDSLYSDKILAVLREYSANAWDANRMVGKGDVPITVTLPTRAAPELVIRDSGPGLSREDVFTIYTQYGASTKRSSDAAVGMLGIGSKSGFAYADSFTVTSWHGGTKAIYVAALDPSDKGVINLLHEECLDCGRRVRNEKDEPEAVCCECTSRMGGETGVQVSISVRREDISDFEERAEALYEHFTPRPIINCDLPEIPTSRTALVSGSIDYLSDGNYNAGKWWAVMGCIAYRIDLDQLTLCAEHACLRKLSGTLKFDIGDVQINASRETLQYKAKTKDALVEKFTALVDEYVVHVLAELEDPALKPFERRLRALTISALDLPIPDDIKELAKGWVRVFEESDSGPFTIVRNGSATNQLTVDSELVLYLDDTHKNLKGYPLGQYHYVIRPKKGTKIEITDLHTLVDTYLDACGLTGVPVKLLSALVWTEPHNSRGGSDPAKRIKHRATMFVFNGSNRYRAPYSSCWDIETRVAEDTDVYVVLENFKAAGYESFYRDYAEDQELATAFGVKLPPVYGYKQTKKKKVDTSKLVGKNYETWRVEFVKGLLTPERIALLQRAWWTTIGPYASAADQKRLVKELGPRHPITRLATARDRAERKFDHHLRNAIVKLATRNGYRQNTSDAQKAIDEMHVRYPLLKHHGINKVWHRGYYGSEQDERAAWVEYIKLVDAREKTLTATASIANSNSKGNNDASVSVH